MLPQSYANKERYYLRAVFDLVFFILVVIIVLNIVFGIIIDSFAELRDHQNAMNEDMRNKCFICSLERQTFDRYSDGFEPHVAHDHNAW